MSRWITSWLLILVFVSVAGCKPDGLTDNSLTAVRNDLGAADGLSLCVSTTGMIGNLVETVGGENVRSVTLMGAGVDPHLFKPTRDDVVLVRQAKALFYNGLHLEGRMGAVFNHLPPSQLKLVVGEWVWEQHGRTEGDPLHAEDPHIWMDVSLWAEAPLEIARTLSSLQPESKTALLGRAEKLREQLLALDEYGQKLIKTIPDNQRVLITSHDAFQYFGKRYNIEVRGVQGMSTESEAGLATISELVNMIVDRGIPTIFVESSVSSNTMRALVEGCAARGKQIQLGGPLFADALGPSGTYEGTYIGMMDHNFRIITEGLGGTVTDKRFAP